MIGRGLIPGRPDGTIEQLATIRDAGKAGDGPITRSAQSGT